MTTWVLDTSTKGTGATMVPLKKAAQGGSKLAFKPPPRRRAGEPHAARVPRSFKVVDVLTRQVLADGGIGLRATHRIGPTSFTTRVDFPVLVSAPDIAVGAGPLDGRAKFRVVWSLEEAF